MKIGRNDPCPCGSGKKYKQCCLKKEKHDIYSLVRTTISTENYNSQISDVICNLIRFMYDTTWIGACHATASVLYVALNELGYNVELYTGEVAGRGIAPFDHSWITLDGKIIDIAVIMTLMGGLPISEPIILNKNIATGGASDLDYGIESPYGLDEDTKWIISLSLTEFMDKYPEDKNGLWSIVNKVSPLTYDINALRAKYSTYHRIYFKA